MDDEDEFDGPEHEWIEWTEAELDECPDERWRFECRGIGKGYQLHKIPDKKGSKWITHKTFKLGKGSVDRDGNVVLEPRFDDTMHVDVEHKTVTFTCHHGLCTLNHTLGIDKFITIMTQTFYRATYAVEGRPVRYPSRLVDVAEVFAPSNVVDDGQWWQEKISYFMAEFKKRERTVTIRTKSGDTLISP